MCGRVKWHQVESVCGWACGETGGMEHKCELTGVSSWWVY